MADGFFGREARAFGSAVRFLTRAPAPFPSTDEGWRADLVRSPRYFPLVGGAVGACTGLAFFAL
jgi:cobalamin synthase